MKKRMLCALLALTLLCGCASAQMLPELVRLHVVAADDSPQAQALKLELRDVCLRCAEVCLSDAEDADEAYRRLENHLADFEAACVERARELGYEGEIRAETGTFDFPDRVYGAVKVPAGEYRALRVTIGAGAGHNWWCVLYPSLCVIDEADAASADAPSYSRVWNWLRARLADWM
ncbi:MAG: stage II sporulation protein R [Clostridia bacterium]|nr:stage II sporulation protein R [Clostridia bacterium]